MTDSRSRFEAWRRAHNPFGVGRNTEPGRTEEYDSPFTQQQWEAWQAAERETARRIAAIVDGMVTDEDVKWEFRAGLDRAIQCIKAEFPGAWE